VQTEVVDITKLGLMEITRKKVYKTLAEQLSEAQ
jgi:Ribonuclease G/E